MQSVAKVEAQLPVQQAETPMRLVGVLTLLVETLLVAKAATATAARAAQEALVAKVVRAVQEALAVRVEPW